MDFEKLFGEDVFKNVPPQRIAMFKKLAGDIKGKNFNETMDIIVKFTQNIPCGESLSDNEKNAMIGIMLSYLKEDERKNFKDMLCMIESFQNIKK